MDVRSAQPGDFAAITDLLDQLGRSRVPHDDYQAAKQVFFDQLSDPLSEHLTATDRDGRVVGFCSLHFRMRLNHTTPQAWIADLFVSNAVRGRGTARVLLGEAERRARERRCWELTLEAGPARSEANLLYSAFGMTDAGRVFRKAL